MSFWLIGFFLYRRMDLRERRRNCREDADGAAARARSVNRFLSIAGPTTAFEGQTAAQCPQRRQSSGFAMIILSFRR
jgi:hypothetical protein